MTIAQMILLWGGLLVVLVLVGLAAGSETDDFEQTAPLSPKPNRFIDQEIDGEIYWEDDEWKVSPPERAQEVKMLREMMDRG